LKNKDKKSIIQTERGKKMEKEELIIGKKYLIHAYKHDGKIHRSWDEAVLL
jgi:hypothetical protein